MSDYVRLIQLQTRHAHGQEDKDCDYDPVAYELVKMRSKNISTT